MEQQKILWNRKQDGGTKNKMKEQKSRRWNRNKMEEQKTRWRNRKQDGGTKNKMEEKNKTKEQKT